MVYSAETGGRVREDMAMGTERSKPPLHNFNLPLLKWGAQRQLRCVKVHDDESAGIKNGGGHRAPANERWRSTRSPPKKLGAARNYDVRRFKFPNPRIGGGGGGGGEKEEEEGIEAVGEKIMLDLRTEADKMKDAFFRKELSEEDEGREEGEEEDESPSPPRRKASASPPRKPASSAAAPVVEMDPGVRPWNLRTRRAAFKSPNGGNSVPAKGLKIEERRLGNVQSPLRTDTMRSPRLRGEKEKEKQKERPKFSVALSKREIEEDFMEILGQRPVRRPKKRPRIVQKQLDTLFPGLWLIEVTPEMYKVHENPDNAKR